VATSPPDFDLTPIRARERSLLPLGELDFRFLEGNANFWRLVEQGLVSLERTRRADYGIKAGPYVGQAILGDRLLQIEEKIPGALQGLFHFSESPETRLVEAESFIDSEKVFLRSLADQFLNLVDEYLRFGRLKTYQRRTLVGGTPHGAILFPATLRLWAKGRRDLVAYQFNELSASNFPNQAIGFALHILDGMLTYSDDDQRRLDRVRTASMLFEDSRWQALIVRRREALDAGFQGLGPETLRFTKLLGLARLLVLHFGVTTTVTEERMDYSWFVNLESLFEESVRKAVTIAARSFDLVGTDWGVEYKYILTDTDRHRANPDIVLWKSGRPFAVLDAKYKSEENETSSDDLYQLLAHALAWGVDRAVLIYPSDAPGCEFLGTGPANVKTWAARLDVRNVLTSAETVMPLFTRPRPG
jgi:5-methylcytosine-specific restriction endonuclease McrBC regulatory subunit McrC